MGKGYNNYMTKKPFHPGSKANIKRTWMAEQRTENEKRKQEDLKVQYEKEQELYNNRALLSTESKDKLELNFMYEAPPGAKRERQKEDDEPEYKFEWQRKYNAPREDYAKGNADIRDQPFGIPVRNVRCIKCHKWGHINTDKECPLYHHASSSSMPTTSMDPLELMRQMQEDGYNLKQSVLGHHLNVKQSNQQFVASDDSDPEMEFLKSLTSKQKRKLLKKLNKLSKKTKKKEEARKKRAKRKEKVKSKKNVEYDSECEEGEIEEKPKKKRRKADDSSSESESEGSGQDGKHAAWHGNQNKSATKTKHTERSADTTKDGACTVRGKDSTKHKSEASNEFSEFSECSSFKKSKLGGVRERGGKRKSDTSREREKYLAGDTQHHQKNKKFKSESDSFSEREDSVQDSSTGKERRRKKQDEFDTLRSTKAEGSDWREREPSSVGNASDSSDEPVRRDSGKYKEQKMQSLDSPWDKREQQPAKELSTSEKRRKDHKLHNSERHFKYGTQHFAEKHGSTNERHGAQLHVEEQKQRVKEKSVKKDRVHDLEEEEEREPRVLDPGKYGREQKLRDSKEQSREHKWRDVERHDKEQKRHDAEKHGNHDTKHGSLRDGQKHDKERKMHDDETQGKEQKLYSVDKSGSREVKLHSVASPNKEQKLYSMEKSGREVKLHSVASPNKEQKLGDLKKPIQEQTPVDIDKTGKDEKLCDTEKTSKKGPRNSEELAQNPNLLVSERSSKGQRPYNRVAAKLCGTGEEASELCDTKKPVNKENLRDIGNRGGEQTPCFKEEELTKKKKSHGLETSIGSLNVSEKEKSQKTHKLDDSDRSAEDDRRPSAAENSSKKQKLVHGQKLDTDPKLQQKEEPRGTEEELVQYGPEEPKKDAEQREEESSRAENHGAETFNREQEESKTDKSEGGNRCSSEKVRDDKLQEAERPNKGQEVHDFQKPVNEQKLDDGENFDEGQKARNSEKPCNGHGLWDNSSEKKIGHEIPSGDRERRTTAVGKTAAPASEGLNVNGTSEISGSESVGAEPRVVNSPHHPDGFDPNFPQRTFLERSSMVTVESKHYFYSHERYRNLHRHRRSPSVKHKYRN